MKRLLLFVVCLLTVGLKLVTAQAPAGNPVLKLDPALDAVVSAGAKLELLKVDYFGIPEGPVWVREGQSGYLLFSDIGGNLIYKWTPDGKLTPFLDKAGFTGTDTTGLGTFNNGRLIVVTWGPNGLAFDREGRLVICAQGDRSIVRIEKDGTRTTLADRYEGKRINGPNDLAIKSDGAIYFSDPGSGLRGGTNPARELAFTGVYMIKDGSLVLLEKDLRPNGIAFSPDEKYVYLTNAGGKIMRYDVRPDDTIANGALFIDTSVDKAPGGPDGMKVDRLGNLYTTGPGGIWIVSPAGKHIGTILLPEPATNLNFGDADGKMLYITSRKSLYRIRLNASGLHP